MQECVRDLREMEKNSTVDKSRITQILRVPLKSISFADYQRKPNADRIAKIVNEYNPDRDRPIELSYRSGKYWCFDGQHRVRAHQLMHDKDILAQVHYGLCYQDEAFLFQQQDVNVKKVSASEKWLAGVEAGNKSASTTDITKVCKEYGYLIDTSTSNLRGRTFGCVAELNDLYKNHGKNGLVNMIWVLEAFHGANKCTNRYIVGGLNVLMSTYKLSDKDWDRLKERVEKTIVTPEILLRRVIVANGGKYSRKMVAKEFVTIFNSGLGLNSKRRLNIEEIK